MMTGYNIRQIATSINVNMIVLMTSYLPRLGK